MLLLWNCGVFGMLQSYSVLAYHTVLFCFNEFLGFAFLFLPLLYQNLIASRFYSCFQHFSSEFLFCKKKKKSFWNKDLFIYLFY